MNQTSTLEIAAEWRAPSITAASAFRELLGSSGVELKPDDRLVANDPGVMPGLDDVSLAWAYVLLAAVRTR